MKIDVIGGKCKGKVIQGNSRIGHTLTLAYDGHVKKGHVARGRGYTITGISFDNSAVIIKGVGGKAKGPIAKGVGLDIQGLYRQQI